MLSLLHRFRGLTAVSVQFLRYAPVFFNADVSAFYTLKLIKQTVLKPQY